MLEIINARYLHDKIIEVEFNNGEIHKIDFSDKLANEPREIFRPLGVLCVNRINF